MEQEERTQKTQWHHLAGMVLEETLPSDQMAVQSGEDMINLNTAELEHMGRVLGDSVVKRASIATRLAGLSAEERLSGLSAEEVVRHFKPEDIWAGLSPEERQKLMELGRAN